MPPSRVLCLLLGYSHHPCVVIGPLAKPAPIVPDEVEVQVVGRRRSLTALDLGHGPLREEQGGASRGTTQGLLAARGVRVQGYPSE